MFEWIYFNTNYSIKKSNSSFPKKVYVFFHASVITNGSHVEENLYISQISCAYSCTKKYLPLIYFIPGVRLRYDWVGEFKTGRIHMSQNIIFFYTTLFWRFQECAEAFASVEGRSNPVCNEFVNSWFINNLLNIWEERYIYIYIPNLFIYIISIYSYKNMVYISLFPYI